MFTIADPGKIAADEDILWELKTVTKGDSDQGILHPLDCAEWHLWALRISKIVARAWVDEEFKDALIADPAEALNDAGLAVPKGTEVIVKEGATDWSMTGSSLTKVDQLVLPLPPKPEADALIKAWAEGETGHPPILSDEGSVSFEGVPAIEDSAARRIVDARRVADARRVGEGRRIADARRITEGAFDAAVRRSPKAVGSLMMAISWAPKPPRGGCRKPAGLSMIWIPR